MEIWRAFFSEQAFQRLSNIFHLLRTSYASDTREAPNGLVKEAVDCVYSNKIQHAADFYKEQTWYLDFRAEFTAAHKFSNHGNLGNSAVECDFCRLIIKQESTRRKIQDLIKRVQILSANVKNRYLLPDLVEYVVDFTKNNSALVGKEEKLALNYLRAFTPRQHLALLGLG